MAFRGSYADHFHAQLAEYLRVMEELERTESRVSKLNIDSVYRCAKCNKTVFFNLNLLQTNDWSSTGGTTKEKECSNYLIEPAVWMTATSTGANIFADFPQRATGQIPCPHCNAYIGKFTFHPFQTVLCSCGVHRSVHTYVALSVDKDAMVKKYTVKKSIIAKLIGM